MYKAGETLFLPNLENFSGISLDRAINVYKDAVMT
jgi:hypothetical protein